MNIVSNQDVSFDDKATLAMGAAFDQACRSLRHVSCGEKVRDLLAKRIIEAAIKGEVDPIRLHLQALISFGVDDVSMSLASVGCNAPSPAYVSVAQAA